ncbi:hypothetical protein M6B38_333800 [Iris pallida]|uniref:Uncharacterized protein n=1 Tax=Iris pallida TaxID=29817 RepID=A0AAX6H260_IRIPA|nr:hypothetical protein M6B38_333800 [Iris pallida]
MFHVLPKPITHSGSISNISHMSGSLYIHAQVPGYSSGSFHYTLMIHFSMLALVFCFEIHCMFIFHLHVVLVHFLGYT